MLAPGFIIALLAVVPDAGSSPKACAINWSTADGGVVSLSPAQAVARYDEAARARSTLDLDSADEIRFSERLVELAECGRTDAASGKRLADALPGLALSVGERLTEAARALRLDDETDAANKSSLQRERTFQRAMHWLERARPAGDRHTVLMSWYRQALLDIDYAEALRTAAMPHAIRALGAEAETAFADGRAARAEHLCNDALEACRRCEGSIDAEGADKWILRHLEDIRARAHTPR